MLRAAVTLLRASLTGICSSGLGLGLNPWVPHTLHGRSNGVSRPNARAGPHWLPLPCTQSQPSCSQHIGPSAQAKLGLCSCFPHTVAPGRTSAPGPQLVLNRCVTAVHGRRAAPSTPAGRHHDCPELPEHFWCLQDFRNGMNLAAGAGTLEPL